jgi:hypothetical protein
LIALQAIRSPQMREKLENFHVSFLDKMIGVQLATKERFEAVSRQMKEKGIEVNEDVSYEDIKKFYESKAYTINVAQEHHIGTEFKMIDVILPYLDNRKWLIVKTTEETGPLITTDYPVNLMWKEPEKIPAFYRESPGFGLNNTEVYFPLSQNAALIGEFDGEEGVIEGTKELIALLNARKLLFTYKQIYIPKLNFYFTGRKGEILEGRHLLKHIANS